MYLLCCQICNVYSEDIDIKDLEKYFLASSQGQAPGFSPKNFITQSFQPQYQCQPEKAHPAHDFLTQFCESAHR